MNRWKRCPFGKANSQFLKLPFSILSPTRFRTFRISKREMWNALYIADKWTEHTTESSNSSACGERRGDCGIRGETCRLFLHSRDHRRSSIREIAQANGFSCLIVRSSDELEMRMSCTPKNVDRPRIYFPEVSQLTEWTSRSEAVPCRNREIAKEAQWNCRACVNRILLCISNILQNNKISL